MRQHAYVKILSTRKFAKHERDVRVAESYSSLLSALQTSQVLNISISLLKHEIIVL